MTMTSLKKTNINHSIIDLPVEIILTIFKYLDTESQTKVAATCKSWKCLAESCFKWTLYLNASVSIDYKVLRESNRKFSKVYIHGHKLFRHIWEFMIQPNTSLINSVTAITIYNATFHLLHFNNLSKMFPILEYLELISVRIQDIPGDEEFEDHNKPNFHKLKKLFLCDESNSKLLLCFTNAKLTTFHCRQQHLKPAHVWKFLSNQKELKEIDFCRIASSTTSEFGVDPSKVNFTLKKFAFDYMSVSDFNGIIDLILLQPKNFETIECGHLPNLSAYTIIFSNLKNLKTLHLMPGCVRRSPNNREFELQSLRSVTYLRVYDGINYGLELTSIETMTIKIIENLPNLEELELFMPYNVILYQAIIGNLRKLKKLTIRVTYHTQLKNLKFPPVASLRINCFVSRIYRRGHQPISMVIEGEETQIQESVRSLTYDGLAGDEFFGVIRKNFPMLETLEVRKDLAKLQHASVSDIRQVHYRDKDFFSQVGRFEN